MEGETNHQAPPETEAAPNHNNRGAGSRRRLYQTADNQTDADILVGTPYEHMPEYFDDFRDGGYVHEREPMYYVQGGTFLGEGRYGTLYEEDAFVLHAGVPNDSMQPLNRAAAINFVKWQQRLPQGRVPLDIGDMAEAAQMLGSDPEILKLNRVDWQNAVCKMANELRRRREGPQALEIPPIGHNFTKNAKPTAPPILGARLAEMAERFPGQTRFATSVPIYGPGAQTRRPVPSPMSSSGR